MVIFYINNRKQPWSGNHADFMNGMFITMPATLQVESDTQQFQQSYLQLHSGIKHLLYQQIVTKKKI